MDDLLKLRQFQRYSEDDVKKVVADNDKKRFAVRNDPATDRLQIRANQGHTLEVSIFTLYSQVIDFCVTCKCECLRFDNRWYY